MPSVPDGGGASPTGGAGSPGITRGVLIGTKNYFDISYGNASASFTEGTLVIATTGAAYHGFAIQCTSAGATFKVYDSTGSAAGNLLDVAFFGATVSTAFIRVIPVQAKKGIVVNVTSGTGSIGTIFYGPKG